MVMRRISEIIITTLMVWGAIVVMFLMTSCNQDFYQGENEAMSQLPEGSPSQPRSPAEKKPPYSWNDFSDGGQLMGEAIIYLKKDQRSPTVAVFLDRGMHYPNVVFIDNRWDLPELYKFSTYYEDYERLTYRSTDPLHANSILWDVQSNTAGIVWTQVKNHNEHGETWEIYYLSHNGGQSQKIYSVEKKCYSPEDDRCVWPIMTLINLGIDGDYISWTNEVEDYYHKMDINSYLYDLRTDQMRDIDLTQEGFQIRDQWLVRKKVHDAWQPGRQATFDLEAENLRSQEKFLLNKRPFEPPYYADAQYLNAGNSFVIGKHHVLWLATVYDRIALIRYDLEAGSHAKEEVVALFDDPIFKDLRSLSVGLLALSQDRFLLMNISGHFEILDLERLVRYKSVGFERDDFRHYAFYKNELWFDRSIDGSEHDIYRAVLPW